MGEKKTKDGMMSSQEYFLFAGMLCLVMGIGMFLYCIVLNMNFWNVVPFYASPVHWLVLGFIFVTGVIVNKFRGDVVADS